MGLLEERIVIVTGGGRGIGRAHCLELAGHGAIVIVNDFEAGPAEEVVAEITATGARAFAAIGSVTDFDEVGRLVVEVVAAHGRLDGVVNNAGFLRDRVLTGMSEDEFDTVVAVHLKGTWALTKHACDHWRSVAKAGGTPHGRIVNTTSGTGLFGNPGQANYGAAKAGIANLTLISAMEMERYGVTVNAISPVARTRMTEALPSMQPPSDGGWDRYDPGNSSPVVAWLLSDDAAWLSGAVLRVDGDVVQRMQPWSIDERVQHRTGVGERLDAASLGKGLRAAFGTFPPGMPAGAITR